MSEQWTPVEDGYTYRQPSYPVTSLTFHNNSLVISDRNTKEIVLPTDLRLCELVEVEPVPVEALRQILVGIEMAYGTSEDSWQIVNAWLDKLEVGE